MRLIPVRKRIRSPKEMQKASEELTNHKKVDPTIAGPSGSTNRLNYQRQFLRTKFKEERKAPYMRSGKIRSTKRYREEKSSFQKNNSQDRPHKKEHWRANSRYHHQKQ
ncbi:unnamed protein product [Acanthoscelides obtectus]|uniref:Uncharacterized protein n=1 Tax=Acanthoscelides obtectus TaxID=200917 RepID=A0A9P0KNH8_ACAOB|nr:unnamed protein product [Acanthoscelides obtectus]CAK1623615.1 hypothetical protein AOBTE_LOCUS2095 [Acanthoscelides obtectus]